MYQQTKQIMLSKIRSTIVEIDQDKQFDNSYKIYVVIC